MSFAPQAGSLPMHDFCTPNADEMNYSEVAAKLEMSEDALLQQMAAAGK